MAERQSKQRHSRKVVELAIESIGARGDGIGRADGRLVYVPLTVAGDRLRVELERPRGDGYAGRIIEVLAEGPGRVPAPCPQFGQCGGCSLQHVEDGRYAAWKEEQLRTALARRGFADPPLRPLLRIAPGTRRRANLTAERAGRSVHLGFHARESHRVVDAAGCLVLTPALSVLLSPLRDALLAMLVDGERVEVTATATDSGVDLLMKGKRPLSLESREALAALAAGADLARITWRADRSPPDPVVIRRPARIAFAGVAVDLPPGAFLQPTVPGEAALVEAVSQALSGCRQVADLYAGCGTFTFPLARGAHVDAVEGDAEAIGALAGAARRAALGHPVTTEHRDLASDPLTEEELKCFDGVVFDPPRAGAKAQAERLARSTVPKAVAVSCDPATFARDARILVDGGYRLLEATPIDQFIWSPHVEIVALFVR
jgi:23S rRNA (uracil1939-C5)-methyltransferase